MRFANLLPACWLVGVGALSVAVMSAAPTPWAWNQGGLGMPVATAQPAGPAAQPAQPAYRTRRALSAAERDLVWKQLIPALAGRNHLTREAAKDRLLTIGLPAVVHLVDATRTDMLLPKLKDYGQLARLKPEIESDLHDWFTRNAPNLRNRPQMAELLSQFRRFQSDDAVMNGVRAFYEALGQNNENVPPPGVLNSVRGYAAKTIGEIGDVSAWQEIRRLLDDQSEEVYMYAIEALGNMRAPLEAAVRTDSNQPDIYQFCTHENVMVRSRVWSALRKMDARQAVERLIGDLATAGDDPVRRDRIVECLQGITLRSYGPSAVAWQRWWAQANTMPNPLDVERPRG